MRTSSITSSQPSLRRESARSQGDPVAEPEGDGRRDPLVVQEGAVLGSGVAHSQPAGRADGELRVDARHDRLGRVDRLDVTLVTTPDPDAHAPRLVVPPRPWVEQGDAVRPCPRSEEHTSELQSRLHLVCRLLLEKKK